MTDVVELDRKLSRALLRGRGIRLEAHELDLLVSVGAIERLKTAASDELAQRATDRIRQRMEKQAKAPTARSAEDARSAMDRVERVLRSKRVRRTHPAAAPHPKD